MAGYVSNNGIIHTLHLPFQNVFNILQTLVSGDNNNRISGFDGVLSFGDDDIALAVNTADK